MERQQVNVRLEQDLADRMDKKRIELTESLGHIPTRSDIVRMALEEFLEVPENAKISGAKTAKVKKGG